jgi:hypothetical protein
LIRIALLNKIDPFLFSQITENEFIKIYSQIFLNTKFPLNAISTIIQFISNKNDNFIFTKIIKIFEVMQVELFELSLLLDSTGLKFFNLVKKFKIF